jgi:hypothetical protein
LNYGPTTKAVSVFVYNYNSSFYYKGPGNSCILSAR